MAREALGEFEHQVMLALLQLGQHAYSAEIVLELEQKTGRPVRAAAVYIVLRRLEEKGLVTSMMQDPGEAGGRDRRHFRVTRDGRAKVREAHATYMRLWEGLEERLRKTT
jgi:DNA-binding PadR family transcriptional regulator